MTGKRERNAFIVYPNVLFSDVAALEAYDHIFLVEEPLFFGGKGAVRGREYDIGKMKLVYMRASMKVYRAYLNEHKFRVSYVDYDDVGDYNWLSTYKRIGTYQIIDFELMEKLQGCSRLGSLKFEATLLFPLPVSEICDYFGNKGDSRNEKPQRYIHSHFYKWAKSKLGLLENVKSFDTENRRPLPRDHKLKHHTPGFNNDRHHSAILEEASQYISKHSTFKNNIGSYDRLFMYPLDHAGAKKLFVDFLNNRLDNFGPYQDAIDRDEPILYHSFCSTVLNNGLLSSDWVIEQLKKRCKELPMRSLEAYVRQLCWRMWEVGIYLCFYDELRTSNHFKSTRKLKWEKWRGKNPTALGIEPVDNEIRKAVDFGYAAHIPRLMVFLNIFVMLQVRPEDVVRWFMEIVSMDATIYFMWAIVTTMGAYNLRFMQKPYVSTSAYLLKMSNYPKGEWCETFTALFYDFLCRNKSKLKGSCSIYLRNLAHFERKNKSDQARIKKLANSFRNKVTS